MSNRAYVLFNVEESLLKEVVDALRSKSPVAQADAVNGPYNAIAVVEARNSSALARLVLADLKRLEGVKDITVFLALPGEVVESQHRNQPAEVDPCPKVQ